MNEDTNIGRATPMPGEGKGLDPRRVISPELVLVDPELAAWARAQLVSHALVIAHELPDAGPIPTPKVYGAGAFEEPGRPSTRPAPPGWRPERGSSTPVGSASIDRGPAAPAATPGRLRRRGFTRRLRPVLAAAALLLAAIALMPRSASDRPILAGADASTTPAPQTFVWPALETADGYEVTIVRGARAVLVAQTTEPRLTLPGRWIFRGRSFTLSPGSYRWSVWPLGPDSVRAGEPIVEAKLEVERR